MQQTTGSEASQPRASATEHCVTVDNRSVRMFRHDWIERCSHVHPVVPHVIFWPVIVTLLVIARTPPVMTAALVLAGLVVWTLTEYILHRFLFHAPDAIMEETHRIAAALAPDEPVIPALPTFRHVTYFIAHGVHHEYPSDSSRLVLPPTASVPLAVVFYGLFRLAFGAAATPPMFAGFITGYLIYDTVHYAVHHPGLPTAWGRFLKRRHARHHFVDPDRDYGVSSPLWDWVLGTLGSRPAEPRALAE
jgi:sterol desaturase/sphingolipid hydroxylase (fatty acid hydroxylase superfamily)